SPCYRKDGAMCNGGAACNWGFVLTETSSFDGFWAGPCHRSGLGKEQAEISFQLESLTAPHPAMSSSSGGRSEKSSLGEIKR
ncbi:hypothetical protein AVEN_40902-1, partial [Araneus ventricosus]